MKKLKLLFSYMYGYRIKYFGAILCTCLSVVVTMISPLIIKFALDFLIGSKEAVFPGVVEGLINLVGGLPVLKRNLWICGLALLLINILNGLFQFLRGKWAAQASESIAKNIRDSLYNHLQNLPYDYHVKAETGDLIQRCTSDVETVRRFLAVQLVEIGRALFTLIVAISIMLSLHVGMTMISMAAIPFTFTFAMVFFMKVRKAFRLSDEAEGRLSNTLQENLTGVRVVRAFGRQKHEMEKFDLKNREHRDLTYRLILLMAAYWSISDTVTILQICAVLVTGSFLAAKGILSLGTLTVFMAYEGMLLWPIRQTGRILTDLGKTMISLERIEEIMKEPLETQDEDCIKPPLDGDIEFKNVCFEYEPGKPVLKDLSFKIKRGQTVAILGPTGSGKSSLVHLLQRLYDYQHGSITIGGTELKRIDKKHLRKKVGIVLQEPFLYSKTIRDNIKIAKRDASDDEVYTAAKIAAVHDVIEEFEKGYETPVGERGVTLSGGQKQRVAIARTVINDCSILIFDDSLSAVDTETDAAIRKELKKRSSDITTFIISHRVTTLSEADIILVLEEGRLVQSGTHDELMNQEGLYKRIWMIQNELQEELELGEGIL